MRLEKNVHSYAGNLGENCLGMGGFVMCQVGKALAGVKFSLPRPIHISMSSLEDQKPMKLAVRSSQIGMNFFGKSLECGAVTFDLNF
jgi:hypothetical protein